MKSCIHLKIDSQFLGYAGIDVTDMDIKIDAKAEKQKGKHNDRYMTYQSGYIDSWINLKIDK